MVNIILILIYNFFFFEFKLKNNILYVINYFCVRKRKENNIFRFYIVI